MEIGKALDRGQLTLKNMGLIEIALAFAAQVLACCDMLSLASDDVRG